MVGRNLVEYDEDAAETALVVMSIVVVAVPAALFVFLSGLWTARLQFVLAQVLDLGVRIFTSLQGLCALAYAVPGWSKFSYRFLRCAEHWVWVDYFDGLIESEAGEGSVTHLPQDLSQFRFDHWSRSYYGNGFTATAFLIVAIACCFVYFLATFCSNCVARNFRFFQLDFLVKMLQITHLRLSISLLLEVRLIDDGREASWTTGTGICFAFVATVLLPLVLMALMCIYRNTRLKVLSPLTREYRIGSSSLHFLFPYIENVCLAIALCIIGQWRDAQAYVIVSLMGIRFLHVVVFRFFALPERNAGEAVTRALVLGTAVMLVLVYHREDIEMQEEVQGFVIFILVLVFLLVHFLSGVVLTVVSLCHVRSFFTDEELEDFFSEYPRQDAAQATQANIPKRQSPEASPLSHSSPRTDLQPTSPPKESIEDNNSSSMKKRRRRKDKEPTEG